MTVVTRAVKFWTNDKSISNHSDIYRDRLEILRHKSKC